MHYINRYLKKHEKFHSITIFYLRGFLENPDTKECQPTVKY